jgi:hypothetical protein
LLIIEIILDKMIITYFHPPLNLTGGGHIKIIEYNKSNEERREIRRLETVLFKQL